MRCFPPKLIARWDPQVLHQQPRRFLPTICLAYLNSNSLTVNSNGDFGANNRANPAACAAMTNQFYRMVALWRNPGGRQRQHFLRAGVNTKFATFTIWFVDNDSTLWGHCVLLLISEFFDKNAPNLGVLIISRLSDNR
jgi:hypothetical protein